MCSNSQYHNRHCYSCGMCFQQKPSRKKVLLTSNKIFTQKYFLSLQTFFTMFELFLTTQQGYFVVSMFAGQVVMCVASLGNRGTELSCFPYFLLPVSTTSLLVSTFWCLLHRKKLHKFFSHLSACFISHLVPVPPPIKFLSPLAISSCLPLPPLAISGME